MTFSRSCRKEVSSPLHKYPLIEPLPLDVLTDYLLGSTTPQPLGSGLGKGFMYSSHMAVSGIWDSERTASTVMLFKPNFQLH